MNSRAQTASVYNTLPSEAPHLQSWGQSSRNGAPFDVACDRRRGMLNPFSSSLSAHRSAQKSCFGAARREKGLFPGLFITPSRKNVGSNRVLSGIATARLERCCESPKAPLG